MIAAYFLTLSCKDQPGIVTRVTAELYSYRANIIEAAQFEDAQTGRFFMRVVFTLEGSVDGLIDSFSAVARRYGLDWAIRPRDLRRKVLLLASKFDHCLVDRARLMAIWAAFPSTICRSPATRSRSRRRRSRRSSIRPAPT